MRILVTGASGFVGGHIAWRLAAAGHEVIACGNRKTPSKTVVNEVSEVVSLDLTISAEDIVALFEQQRIELVVHAAAMANANACEEDPDGAYRANVLATENIVHACTLLGDSAPFLVYISTDLVFDAAVAPVGGFAEYEEPLPKSVYAQTKAGGEAIVRARLTRATVMRICLVYAEALGESSGPLGWLVDGLRQERAVPLFTDEFRTPVYAATIAQAIDAIAKNPDAVANTTLHLAGPERLSRFEFGARVASAFSLQTDALQPSLQADVKTLAPRSPDVSLAARQTYELLGVTPESIDSALGRIATAESYE